MLGVGVVFASVVVVVVVLSWEGFGGLSLRALSGVPGSSVCARLSFSVLISAIADLKSSLRSGPIEGWGGG